MRRLAILCSMALFLMSQLVWAAPDAKQKKEAQALAKEAETLVKAGDFKQANEKFEKADQLMPSPSYKLERARMLVELGDFLKAAEVLRGAAELKVTDYKEKAAQQNAAKFLSEVGERTPKIEVKMFQPDASKARVTIDGDIYDPAEGSVAFNPGDHEVVVEAAGYDRWTKTVSLTEQKEESIEVTMTRSGAATGGESGEGEAEKSGGGITPIPAFVLWGVGAVGIGFGIGFGVAAINTTNQVLEDYDCQDGACPSDAEADLDVAKTNGNVSTAAFIIGGVCLAAGTILFFFSDMAGGSDDKEEPKESIRVSPVVGAGYLGVSGRF